VLAHAGLSFHLTASANSNFFMKRIYSVFACIVICSVAQAQVGKGAIIIGGNIAYQDQRSDNPSATYLTHDLNINPSIGKAIRTNLVLGIDLSYSHSISDYMNAGEPNDTQAGNSFYAGVFLRRYKLLGNGFYLFGQAEAGINYGHTSTDYPLNVPPSSDKTNSYGIQLLLYPGIAYAINQHWQIETGLPNFFAVHYNHSSETAVVTGQSSQESKSHSLYISSSLGGTNAFTVGVRYFIGG
jgi:hypothetical protein